MIKHDAKDYVNPIVIVNIYVINLEYYTNDVF